MYLVQDIIQEMEEKYHMFLEEKRGILYTFRKLWREYNITESSDEEDQLKQLVFNIVWASMVVKEDADTIETYGMRICKMLWEYERDKEKLRSCCSDNDIKLIEGMIAQINACKDRMYPVKEMVTEIEGMYHMFLKDNLGSAYVFGNLRDIYRPDVQTDEGLMIQSLIYDIIIASVNLQEEVLTSSQKFCIGETIIAYEKHKEKIFMYYDDNDIKQIEDMIDQINACKEKWVK